MMFLIENAYVRSQVIRASGEEQEFRGSSAGEFRGRDTKLD